MNKNKRVVIFIFLKDRKILIEKRILKKFNGEKYLIPGGRVKESQEDLTQALKREVREELGITPLEFKLLPIEKKITGINGQLLIPYLISRWEGQFPEKVLDRGNPLVWLELDEVLTTDIIPTQKIIEALKVYLKENDTSQS